MEFGPGIPTLKVRNSDSEDGGLSCRGIRVGDFDSHGGTFFVLAGLLSGCRGIQVGNSNSEGEAFFVFGLDDRGREFGLRG